MIKRLILILAIFVAAFSITSGFTYDNSADGTTFQRGWPIGYYHDITLPSTGLVGNNLCGGAYLVLEQCAAARGPAISDSRIAMNAVVWLAISSAVGYCIYFIRQKPKHSRS